MIYFTDEKYQNNTAQSEYEDYSRSIWSLLPKELKQIQGGMLPDDLLKDLDSIDLHDSKIVNFDLLKENLVIEFDTDNGGGLRKAFFTYRFASIVQRPNILVLGGDLENPDSDVMCHEVMVTEGGYTHSLLFASNEELVIYFAGFRLDYKDIT